MEKQPLKHDSAERLMFYGTELSPVSVAIGNINNFSIQLSRQSASTAVPPFNEIVWSFCWCPIGDLPRRILISLFCICDMVLQWLALPPQCKKLAGSILWFFRTHTCV